MRHLYKQLPLTGAIQSMMPMFRRSDSFGRIEIPDEFGYYPGAATEHSEKRAATEHSENDGWLPYGKEYAVDPNGEVTGFYMPDKELASAEQIKDDCEAWKTSFARDQRASFIQNHDHDCTGTCVKYHKKKKCHRASSASRPKDCWARRAQVPLQILPLCGSTNRGDA
jgi:hypothetical protein